MVDHKITTGHVFKLLPVFQQSNLKQILSQSIPLEERKSKIIATIGPASQSVEGIKGLIQNGMDVARINLAFGSYQEHTETIRRIRQAAKECNKYVGIMIDTEGSEIRTGQFKEKQIKLQKGQILNITTNFAYQGDSNQIACSYPDLPNCSTLGNKILLADGQVETYVVGIMYNGIKVRVMNNYTLQEKVNMSLPGQIVNLPPLTQKSQQDIMFALNQDVNFIALSSCRSGNDIKNAKDLLGKKAREIKVFAKIQSIEGL